MNTSSQMSHQNTAIIIVNYRTSALTVDCLRSIAADGWLPGRVIVVTMRIV